jgi:hypothetical protein
MDLEASKHKQPESTATTSVTAGEGVSNTEEDQDKEEWKNGSTAELFATAGKLSNTESEKSEFLFSE